MATSGSFIVKNNYGSATFEWTRSSRSIENKTSTISWTLTSTAGISIKNQAYFNIHGTTYTLEVAAGMAGEVTKSTSGSFVLQHEGAYHANFTVSGRVISTLNSIGHGHSFTNTGTGEETFTVDGIPQPAILLDAPDFNDEENPRITYSNPSGNDIPEIQACIEFSGGSQQAKYRNIPKDGTSYTFNLTDAERKALRQGIAEGDNRSIRFTIRTFIGNSYYYSTITKTLSLINYEPLLNPTIRDVNGLTAQLTGDPTNTFVRYVSNASFTMNAQARKEATIDSRYIKCGSYEKVDFPLEGGIIEKIDSPTIYFNVVDSRGHTEETFKQLDLIPYVLPTTALTLQPLVLQASTRTGTLGIKFSGTCYTGSFGAVDNSLEFELRVLKEGEPIVPLMSPEKDEYILDSNGNMQWRTPNGEEREWFILPDIDPSFGDNYYEAVYELTGLDIGTVNNGKISNPNTFVIQGNVVDKITHYQTKESSVISKPVFDWGKTDFKHNTDVIFDHGKSIVATRADGSTFRAIEPCNASGNTVINWDSYNESISDTEIYGNNIKIRAKENIFVNNTQLDYIVEQKSNGTWFYKKWSSGRIELYGYQNITNEACNATLGGWYRTKVLYAPNFPVEVINPKVVANYESDGYGALLWFTTRSTSEAPGDYYLIRPTSSAGITGVINFYVTGTWE